MEEWTTVMQTERGLSPLVQERARVFGKWMWIYFWTQIISIIPGIIVAMITAAEYRTVAVEAVSWVISGVLVACLFQMGKVQERLRTCAILNVVTLAATLLEAIVGNEFLIGIITLASAVIGLISTYQFMYGCGDALVGVDNELSYKWCRLWKWYIGLGIGGIVGLPLLAAVIAMLENSLLMIIVAIAMIAWGIMLIVQVIKEYVYIYRTAKIFRGIAENLW